MKVSVSDIFNKLAKLATEWVGSYIAFFLALTCVIIWWQHRKNIWDGVWRLVAFDIPEEHRKHRDALRSVLHRAGCIKIQQSIYVYPHPCAELEELLNTNPLLKRRVIYATATRISNEDTLKRRFKLE
jgi:DNA-binding transcriptional regulator PaaX